jgi:hypothetical protein
LKNTNKYVLNFKEPAKEIGPINLDGTGLVPQGPRYTSIDKLLKAKKLLGGAEVVNRVILR